MNFPKARATKSAVLLSGFLLGACSTTHEYKQVKLPAYVSGYFSDCAGRDGTSSLEVFEGGKVQQVLELDWASENSGNLALASYSPLGQTLFQLDYKRDGQKFSQSGKSLEALNDLAVSGRGMLELQGHELGIQPEELACLLGGKLPQPWLSKVVSEKSTAQAFEYAIVDSGRKIQLKVPKPNHRSSASWSADVSWGLYWGLKTMKLSMRLARDEQALIMATDQYPDIECRIVAQEE